MNILSLINALPGAVAQGLIWGIMAIGVWLTFRVLDIADLTVDGTMCTGGAVCIMMMLSGHNVFVSMFVAAFIADLMTYVVTAFQMALNVMTAGDGNFVDALIDFLSIYAVTQIPLAIVEGIILGMFAHYLFTSRPEVFEITESNKLNPLSTEA